MSKYEPLGQFLAGSKNAVVELTFAEIERIIGAKLPTSAYEYPAFWSNNPTGHVNARAWVDAGFESEQVDIHHRRVVFRRVGASSQEAALTEEERRLLGQQRLRQLMGCMKGTVHIPAGIDIMEPVELEWDADKGIIGGEGPAS